MTNKELLEMALKARDSAYTPYSHFNVGAALLAKSGKVYLGCNIENASYPATICAERVALVEAVKNGEREFVKIAVVGGIAGEAADEECFPCGVCLQMLSEFCGKDFKIIMNKFGEPKEYSFTDFLPKAFNLL